MAEPLIAAAGVDKRFGAVQALADVTLSIGAGEFVSLLGPSGCGKSTFLRCIAGLETPDAGRLTLGGAPITAPPQQLGIALQRDALLEWLDVLDNVLLPADFAGLPRARHAAHARELLAMVGLADFAHAWPAQLSGGMRQRVALCRALVTEPRILLMDEPFSALDAITRDDMAELLGELWDTAPRTALFITHSIREAVFLSDRVLVMGPRPATIIEEVAIPFPRPRAPEIEADPRFAALTLHLKARVHEAMQVAA